jgi:hypothetical protein
MVKRLTALATMVAMLVALTGLGSVVAYHEDDATVHDFAHPLFEGRWARTDLPVANLQVERTWMWGPSPYTDGMMEPYVDSPGGWRLVQYFDKSRMELNNPDIVSDSIWDVTQGLLARDLMWGQISIGDDDDAYIPHSEGPSTENVAGDPGPNNGPTYATMAMLIDAPAREEGMQVNQRLEQDGTITAAPSRGVTAAHRVTLDWLDHTVASVFWEFMNSSGLIWDGTGYSQDQLFENPFYATGYPITEAYWTSVRVGGTQKDVLVQCFERRCLTYTPDNEPGWQVESGNVGQHYYRWLQTHVAYDVVATGLNLPRGIDIGPNGTIYVAEAGTGGDTCVTFGEGEEAAEVCAGFTGRVSAIVNGEWTVFADGLPSVAVHGEGSGPQDVYVTDDGTVYVIIGLGGPPAARAQLGEAGEYLGWVLRLDAEGNWEPVVDIAIYEEQANPGGGDLDTNPYSLVVTDDGIVVSDAGMNALLWVDTNDNNTISTLAVFDTRMVAAPPFMPVPPGTTIPMESVPTGVAMGPDGAFYVGELTGFPFEQGSARVWRVTQDGAATVYAEGFTNIVDVSFDADGNLLVLEFTLASLLGLNPENEWTLVGGLTRVHGDLTTEDLAAYELILPIGVVGADDGSIYVSQLAVVPNAGQVVRINP